jgi:phosphatidylglycerophosphate synthase
MTWGHGTRVLNVPNILSIARLPLAAAFLLIPDRTLRVLIIVAAAATDYLDGWWSRNRGQRTGLGEILDPVTDKVFLVTALVAFAVSDVITPVQLALLLARDLYVTLGSAAVLLLGWPRRLRSRRAGKLVTVLQLTALLVLTLAPRLAAPMVAAVAAASAWAIVDYTATALAARRALRPPAHER